MKVYRNVMFIIFILLLLPRFYCVNFIGNFFFKKYDYPVGKDTEVVVGDGSFQILRERFSDIDNNVIHSYLLSFRGKSIDDEVYEYLVYSDYLATKGSNGLTICDFNLNEYYVYSSYDLVLDKFEYFKTGKFKKLD